MHILVTGGAGFIGYHLIEALLAQGLSVTTVDNLNDYYAVDLKQARLDRLLQRDGLQFIRLDIADRQAVASLFDSRRFDTVIHLAAQAGVRYSIDHPESYVDSNLVGFMNVLEGCRRQQVGHFMFASSSSVYGMNSKSPFSTEDRTDYPVSLYAATKKSNELLAYSYSHLYGLPTTGLRFFTVYGPWGRPDMAYFKFTEAILEGKPIDVYNNGQMQRDFTFIDDIVNCLTRLTDKVPASRRPEGSNAQAPYRLYNIGNHSPVTLNRFIEAIESACGKSAIRNLLPMQPGDVPATYADIDELVETVDYSPRTSIEDGLQQFVHWYRDYYR
ncbi:NAD-dependent epimerase [Marinobacterium nitratireducens]|uniref:NAD-dependent epimerase n=1 Tax=Marinobacterium nitratireducens TaxID=518897 RepID=A0A917ZB58_9GAMM|nr:NAD-dependent epimerase [Marinobacterium nitratireducens]GGO78021.1 NAD-dependent epimerase [Marinobacterium nitratireducens]